MRGHDRRKTREQSQREPAFVQKKFGGGENSDLPGSAIGPMELAKLVNAVDYGQYIEGHGGTLRLAATALPGSGTVYDLQFHPTAKKWLLHRGTGLWVAAASGASWTEIKSLAYLSGVSPNSIGGDTTGIFNNGVYIRGLNTGNSNGGVLYWNFTNSGSTRTFSVYKDLAKLNLVAQGTRSGNGDVFCQMQNSSGLIIVALGTVYTSDDTDSGNTFTIISGLLEQSFQNNQSKISKYKNDFIIHTGVTSSALYGSITYVNLTDSTFYCLGAGLSYGYPQYQFSGSGAQAAATPYGRRYLSTFSRIVNTTTGAADYTKNRVSGSLLFESASNNANLSTNGGAFDYGEYWFANTVSAANPNSVNLVNGDFFQKENASPHYTHLSLYGTLDIGVAGIDPSTGLGNNREIYVWLADIDISQKTFSDTISDDTLRSRIGAGFALRSRFWQNIPQGECGVIVNDFLFQAPRGSSNVFYQQLLKPAYIGFYRPDAQFMTFDDGVQVLAETQDQLAIICSRQTWTVNPKVKSNIDPVSSVFTLTNRFPASRTIGVTDWGSFQFIEGGGFIARCTDGSVRIWGGPNWGNDLGEKRVRKMLLNMVDGSASGYVKNAYYLWYRTSSGDAYNTKCLRLGLGGDAGFGWSEVSRSSWPFPNLRVGAVVMLDAKNLTRLMVLDYTTGYLFWIETFTNADAGLTKAWKDSENVSGGTDIAGTIRFRELVGASESDIIAHEESHAFFRPSVPADGYLSGFAVGINAYVDGALTPTGAEASVPKTGDIQIARIIRGNRIQPEITTSTSKFQLVGFETKLQEQDNASIGQEFVDTTAASSQTALAGSLKHLLCRPMPLLNRATGLSYTLTGTAPTKVTGPDGKSYALSFVTGASYTGADAYVYSGDFTFSFWVKGFTVGNKVFQLGGTNIFFIRFNNNTQVSVNGTNVAISTIAAGWHHFVFVRSGTDVLVYQNGVLVTTIAATLTASYGGAGLTINTNAAAMILDIIRIQNASVSAAAVAYEYEDVVNNSGNLILPLA